jgi:hypothetical protein
MANQFNKSKPCVCLCLCVGRGRGGGEIDCHLGIIIIKGNKQSSSQYCLLHIKFDEGNAFIIIIIHANKQQSIFLLTHLFDELLNYLRVGLLLLLLLTYKVQWCFVFFLGLKANTLANSLNTPFSCFTSLQ